MVLWVVTQCSSPGVLRDEPKNGCEGVQIILQCDWIRADIERAVIGIKGRDSV